MKDDAREYGRYLYSYEQVPTLDKVIARARDNGYPEWLLPSVVDGWHAERSDTIYGGFADGES